MSILNSALRGRLSRGRAPWGSAPDTILGARRIRAPRFHHYDCGVDVRHTCHLNPELAIKARLNVDNIRCGLKGQHE